MAADRDNKGRFLKGRRGGPGRPAGYSQMWNERLKLMIGRNFKRIFYSILNEVLKGDTKAGIWMLEYLGGKPADHIEITDMTPETHNLDEIRAEFNSRFRETVN
jgi:hypothetical protein